MTEDLYYRKLESTSTTDLVDMIMERDKQISELEKENLYYKDTVETNTAEWEEQGQRVVALEKEKCELLEIIQDKDKAIKDFEWQLQEVLNDNDNYQADNERLEKENAELKKNYEDSLVAYGVLKNKVDLLAQPSPLESMQDVLITTQKIANEKQKEQLSKAKEIIKNLVEFDSSYKDDEEYQRKSELYDKIWEEAEQFLKENK